MSRACLGAEDLAARFGLLRGDVILGINGVAVTDPAKVEALSAPTTRRWGIEVLRQSGADAAALSYLTFSSGICGRIVRHG